MAWNWLASDTSTGRTVGKWSHVVSHRWHCKPDMPNFHRNNDGWYSQELEGGKFSKMRKTEHYVILPLSIFSFRLCLWNRNSQRFYPLLYSQFAIWWMETRKASCQLIEKMKTIRVSPLRRDSKNLLRNYQQHTEISWMENEIHFSKTIWN